MNILSRVKRELRNNDDKYYYLLGDKFYVTEINHWADYILQKYKHKSIHKEDIRLFLLEEYDITDDDQFEEMYNLWVTETFEEN